jgi:hypothetical protein
MFKYIICFELYRNVINSMMNMLIFKYEKVMDHKAADNNIKVKHQL